MRHKKKSLMASHSGLNNGFADHFLLEWASGVLQQAGVPLSNITTSQPHLYSRKEWAEKNLLRLTNHLPSTYHPTLFTRIQPTGQEQKTLVQGPIYTHDHSRTCDYCVHFSGLAS
jgi:hypothetical protein